MYQSHCVCAYNAFIENVSGIICKRENKSRKNVYNIWPMKFIIHHLFPNKGTIHGISEAY